MVSLGVGRHCGKWLVVIVAGCCSYWMLYSSFFLYGYGGHVGLLLSSFGVVVMVEITKLKHESDNTKVQWIDFLLLHIFKTQHPACLLSLRVIGPLIRRMTECPALYITKAYSGQSLASLKITWWWKKLIKQSDEVLSLSKLHKTITEGNFLKSLWTL